MNVQPDYIGGVPRTMIEEYCRENPNRSVPNVMGRFHLPPRTRSAVEEIARRYQ